ncbi:MAG: hypothetical protein AAGG48_07925 [Planctomycetota bacterium]
MRLKSKAKPLGLVHPGFVSKHDSFRILAVEKYDMSIVTSRIRNRELVPSELVEESVLEFRRMMAICALGYSGFQVPCPEVDEVWHAFILFTREYEEFCSCAVGRFIHHAPPETQLPRVVKHDYSQLHRKFFGSPVTDLQRSFVEAPPICQSSIACSIDNELADQSCSETCSMTEI